MKEGRIPSEVKRLRKDLEKYAKLLNYLPYNAEYKRKYENIRNRLLRMGERI